MWSIRGFHRRIPLGPTIIAFALITLLVVTNIFGPRSDLRAGRDGSAPSPADIPPQLPAQDQSIDAAPGPTTSPTPPPAGTAAANGPQVAQPTVTVTATVTAPAGQAPVPADPSKPAATTPSTTATSAPLGVPPQGTSRPTVDPPPTTTVTPTTGGGNGGGGGQTTRPPAPTFRVTGVRVTSDRAGNAYVKCDGLDEVVFAGTVFVDGGAGDVVYQWVFDRVFLWPPDVLPFTGTGARQQTLQIPWRVPPQLIGKITGTIQLRILQPIANAQTERYDINFRCSPLFGQG